MDNLYHETHNLILASQSCFSNLDQEDQSFENQIKENITKINNNLEKLDTYLFKIPINQRQVTRIRNDQLKYDLRNLQSALQSWKLKQSRLQANLEREQLLMNTNSYKPNDITAINIDYSIQHNNSLLNTNRGMDEILSTGQTVLESLRFQKGTLKGARRRLLDMGNTLGLSNHTMKLIERRVSVDKFILFGGMILTLIIIALVIYFLA